MVAGSLPLSLSFPVLLGSGSGSDLGWGLGPDGSVGLPGGECAVGGEVDCPAAFVDLMVMVVFAGWE